MADRPPAFQFYPRDFLTDEKVIQMSNTEVGIYTRLLCHCWLEGTLPLETAALAHMAKMPIKQFTKVWERSIIRSCFFVGDDGRLHQKRLDRERNGQLAYKRGQSHHGKAGAEARWHRDGETNGVAMATPLPGAMAIDSSASASASASALSLSERVMAEPDVSDRARNLLEAYADWYSRWRHGARLRLLRNALEFQDACDLCRTWDDARLEKLAKIVLTTDEPFIANTDRSFKIFALKASWADDRLRQVETAVAV